MHHEYIFSADQLMMLKMHVADKGVIGKTRRAVFAVGE
jgi:hypothetical protein